MTLWINDLKNKNSSQWFSIKEKPTLFITKQSWKCFHMGELLKTFSVARELFVSGSLSSVLVFSRVFCSN